MPFPVLVVEVVLSGNSSKDITMVDTGGIAGAVSEFWVSSESLEQALTTVSMALKKTTMRWFCHVCLLFMLFVTFMLR
jgi:hypothetical protein